MIHTSQEVPNGWKLTRLGDVLSGIDAGVSPKALDRPARAHELGVLKVSSVTWNEFRPYENKALPNDFDATDCPRVRRGDLLLSRANTVELLAAPVIVFDDYPNLLLSDKTLRLVPKREVGHAPYLLHILRTQAARRYFESHATGTSGSMRNVSQATICACPIALPPLAEQQRIAAILDQAEALRAKRRHALVQLDTLTQSLFLDLFGDPATNPHCWPVHKIGELSTRVTKGESPHWQGFGYEKAGVRFVTSENVGWGKLIVNKDKFISEQFNSKLNRSQLREHDLLINLVGASIGRACLTRQEILPANVNQAVAVVSLDDLQVLPNFALEQVLTPQIQKRLLGEKVEAARANISLANIRSLGLLVPPLPLQREFAAQVAAVERLKTAQRASLAKLDALFVSLQHRAFRGEL